jgi:hypothetical protein
MKRHDLFTWKGEGKSMKRMHRTILGLVVSVVMVGALSLFGCGDGGVTVLETCSASNLAGRTFTFNGAPFNLGIVTVIIGPTGTDFTLTAGGKTATGTISYSPQFKITVTSSTFPAGTFPGVGTSFTASSCTVNDVLTLTDLTGTTGTSGG